MRNGPAMFNSARNIVVKDSSLTVNSGTSTKISLDKLLDEVAPNAILNAGGRADEVRCYPGTREEVIQKIEACVDGDGIRKSRMMWLSGPAGAGKSAIFQTVSERCQQRGLHASNFFFFRDDGTRNQSWPLVATLVYQLLEFYPALKEILEDCLTAKPLICKASIDQQFIQLISSPIQMLRNSSLVHQQIIIIIDGLDECDDERKQEQIVVALYALVEKHESTFIVLIASRAEPNLVMSFNNLGTSVESIFLNDEYRPQDDICRFVTAKFDEIKGVHHLAHTLGKSWPAQADIDAITDKSSGQFIYAATVMRFIQYSTLSPAISLLRVYGMRPAASHSPLSHLDSVYSYIFSKAHDFQAVKLILGAHIIIKRGSPSGIFFFESRLQELLGLVGYDAIEIESFLADLVAIVQVSTGPPIQLFFYHASLYDYLADKSRSGIYYLNVDEIAGELSLICLKNMHDLGSWGITATVLEHVKTANPELSESLLEASERNFLQDKPDIPTHDYNDPWKAFVSDIYKIYYETDKVLYRRMLQRWVRFAYRNNLNTIVLVSFYQVLPILSDSEYCGRRYFEFYDWYVFTEGIMFALGLHT